MSDVRDLPLVSIPLCTYNGRRFLPEQLESLLAQTYSNLEIVACDDGSTDDTLSILQRYAQRDARIRIVANPENVGFARNFERALTLCRGLYIAPSDQDDVWLPEKIAALIEAIGASSLAYCDSSLVDEHGASAGYRLSQVVRMSSTDDPAPFAFGNCVSGHAMLFRRELLERASPTPPAFFYDWWIAAVAAAAGGVVFLDRSLVLYRQHGSNVTSGRFGEMLEEAGLAERRGPRDSRPRGAKLRYIREVDQRLAALARLPGGRQAFIATVQRLWRARQTQWFSPRLAALMHHHRERLLALTGLTSRRQKRYCRRLFRGVRLERWLNEVEYADPADSPQD